MVTLTEEITVSTPIESAYAFAADFSNLPLWDPGIASSRQLDDNEVGPGASFEVIARFAGHEVPMRYTITEWTPSSRVVLEGHAAALHAVDTIDFESIGQGTRIRYTADLTFRGVMRVFEPLLKTRLVRMGKLAVEGLAKALDDRGRATL